MNGEIPNLSLSPTNDYILPILFPAIPDLPNLEDWEQDFFGSVEGMGSRTEYGTAYE